MNKYDIGLDWGGSDIQISDPDISGFPELMLENASILTREHKRGSPWGVRTGGSITSRSTIHDGVLYFGANDHNFYAVDIETGREVWRYKTKGPVSIWGFPLIYRDGVIFTCYDNNVYYVSLDGKRTIWRFQAKDIVATTPCLHDGVAYFGSKDNNFYAISLESGRLLWKTPLNSEIAGSPAIHDNSLYFGSRSGLYKISLTGKVIWKFPLKADVDGKPAIHNNVLFFGATDNNVYAVSTSGKLIWRFHTKGPLFCDPIVYKERIYVGSMDGSVYCLNLDGGLVWRFTAGDYIIAGPEVERNRVFFSSADKNVYCTDIEGRLLWKAHSEFLVYITVGDRAIYGGGWDCKMYSFSLEGKPLWEFKTSLSYQSDFIFEPVNEVSFDVIHIEGIQGAEKAKRKEAEKELGSYGDFKGQYIGEDMRDYMGQEIEKGAPGMKYRTGKGVYRK
jgi:outer membrane protein assembly factor BamB